jgi:hypothetical protein
MSILKVTIVGITTEIKAKVLLIAPNPTTIPPRQPTIVNTTQIMPNRLNSACANNLSSPLMFLALISITSILNQSWCNLASKKMTNTLNFYDENQEIIKK